MDEKGGSLRVLQLIGNLEIGGAQEVVRTLAACLRAEGFPTIICSLRDGPLRKVLEEEGIPVVVVPGRTHSIVSLPGFFQDMLRIRNEIRSLIEKERIDVVQTHLLRTLDFLVASLRIGKKKPLVFWTVHNVNFDLRPEQIPGHRWALGLKRYLHHAGYRFFSRWVNAYIAVAADVEAPVRAAFRPPDGKVVVIPNGVDIRRYQREVDRISIRRSLGLPVQAGVVTVVGTLKEQKGHRFLLEGIAPVIKDCPSVHLLIVGDGELRPTLEDFSKSLGLEKNVHYLGNRADVPDILAASDYFILPSLWEGLPMALIEAMAAGLPVIATRVSGSQQVVQDGVSGVLVPPGNAGALKDALGALLVDPARASKLGTDARQRVTRDFSAEKQAREHMYLFQRVWAQGSADER